MRTYPTVRALQWIDGQGVYRGLARAGWYPINPVIVLPSNAVPYNAPVGFPACQFEIQEFELL